MKYSILEFFILLCFKFLFRLTQKIPLSIQYDVHRLSAQIYRENTALTRCMLNSMANCFDSFSSQSAKIAYFVVDTPAWCRLGDSI